MNLPPIRTEWVTLGALLKLVPAPAETLAELVAAIEAGQLLAYRPAKKGRERELLPPGFLAGVAWLRPGAVAIPTTVVQPLRPERDGLRFDDVLLHRADLEALFSEDACEHTPAIARIDHGNADAPLVKEMKVLLAEGRARDPLDAARAVAGRAAGHGNEESKARRLRNRFKEAFGV